MAFGVLLSACGTVPPAESLDVQVKSIPESTYSLAFASESNASVEPLKYYHYKEPGPWSLCELIGDDLRPFTSASRTLRLQRPRPGRVGVLVRDDSRNWRCFWFAFESSEESGHPVLDLSHPSAVDEVSDEVLVKLGIRYGLGRPKCSRLSFGEDRERSDKFLRSFCRYLRDAVAKLEVASAAGNLPDARKASIELLDAADLFVANGKWSEQESTRLEKLYLVVGKLRALDGKDLRVMPALVDQLRKGVDELCPGK